ncbi:aquaporin-11 [Microcaecilia unicolor]|uniref:Aquaporin n=1 Tax=Microcaecilia unicolor TaxID=1415580 RepID=A0A6P7XRT2_9AMPH|nr:aquaporin-11 [Microcaecilia unicolor]
MADSRWVSLALLVSTVLSCEALRTCARKKLKSRYRPLFVEFVSTLQLCCCVHELRLLGEHGAADPQLLLILVYAVTMVNVLTFAGATCNPNGTLEQLLSGRASLGSRTWPWLACQFGAALLARFGMARLWTLKLSPLHSLGCLECQSGIHTDDLLLATGVEAFCAFVVQNSLLYVRGKQLKYQAHVFAAIVVLLVYAGGNITGAVFNQALAFSIYFHCKGNTFLEYAVVYWLGPAIGMAFSVVLCDCIFPRLSSSCARKSKCSSKGEKTN